MTDRLAIKGLLAMLFTPRSNSIRFGMLVLTMMVVSAFANAESPQKPTPAAIEYFEKKVRPILVDNCYTCHSADTNSKGGLRVDDRNGLITGGSKGPAVVPGQPEKSLLIKAVRHDKGAPVMPPKKDISEEDIVVLTKWIQDGAAWPEVRTPKSLNQPNPVYDELRATHWSWQPLTQPKTPTVTQNAWMRGEIDRYILATLEQKKLQPVADADKLTLIRRVTFDLTGLPPTPAEIDAFLADQSPEAYAVVVDRLLASPAFGERWGRHWLDVARYGESTGSARNLPYPHAWRYRDYVINAVNRDKPYDQFIREQIAGDLLPYTTPEQHDEQQIATAFLALGVKDVNQRFKVRFVMDNIDEQIDTVTRSVLALTASCARCHDHKFDPITQSDYYAIAGIFSSTDHCAGLRNKMGGGGLDYYDPSMLLQVSESNAAPESTLPQRIARAKEAFEDAKDAFELIRGTADGKALAPDGRPMMMVARLNMVRLQGELLALTDPASKGLAIHGVRDAKVVGDTELRVRGEAEKLGPMIPRGYLSVVNIPDAPKINPNQSGRLELAQWLTNAKNPLTSRVMANRIWHHLFGAGLVISVDNFGTTGDTPSHPELLDYLANRFIQNGWSVKKLIREVVLSRAYQLGSDATKAHTDLDPANRFVWRHSPRRLTAEELRDAMLLASGQLDSTQAGAPPSKELRTVELRNNGPEAVKLTTFAANSRHRSVYLPLVRGVTPNSLAVFDFAEQGMVTGDRDATIVAPQALYLLNDPFVLKQSLALAQRVLKENDETARLKLAYRLTLGREPSSIELEKAKNYITDYATDYREFIKANPLPVVKAPKPMVKNPNSKEPENPDDIDPTDAPRSDESVRISDPVVASWASFCQALIGSAEFRYLK